MRNGRRILYVSGLFGQRGFDVGQHLFAQQHERLLGASGRRAGAAHILAGEEALGHGAGRGIGIAEEFVLGRFSQFSSALLSKPGPMEVLKSALPAPSCSNSCAPSSSTFLFRQVKTTSLSERSWSSGL